MKMNGSLFNIQRFSTHDGPGVRTVVFLKGCTLRCAWCHNPESIPFGPSLAWHADRCVHCGRCVPVCPHGAHAMTAEGLHVFDRSRCVDCLACTEVCFAEALLPVGRTVTPEEVFAAVQSDASYYGETGGVTFSGGESLAQPDFLEATLKLCRAGGFHTAVDTAGSVPWSSFARILPYTNLFLYDVKAIDPVVHRQWMGADNALILENLRRLVAMDAPLRIRVPFVPGANGQEMTGIARFLSEMSIAELDLLPYHRLGEGKRVFLGIEAETEPFRPPMPDEWNRVVEIFAFHGITACSDG